MQLKFSKKPPAYVRNNPHLYKEAPIFKFESQTFVTITNTPLLMDPLDRANVFIGESKIEGVTGDALIAKRDIPAFAIVVFYAGVRVEDSDVSVALGDLNGAYPRNA
jgi:hypothetical protein